jgi:glycosyltransferase involved in cell wall biosynthesis
MPPRVTVIIATYNWSSVLPYSIGSVLRQTFPDFELLVVGDGCTDDSEEVVARIDDPRIRWINLPQNTRHQSGPNNEGLRQARGELIAYLGHDDLWLPHHLRVMIDALDAAHSDMAHSLAACIAPGGELIWPAKPNSQQGSWGPPSCIVHRRAVTEAVGGWRDYRELTVVPEVDIWRRARDAGFQFTFVPRLTVIKFPAAMRRGAYRTRSCREQAQWSARIASEPDLEPTQLARMLIDDRVSWQEPYWNLVRRFVATTMLRMRRRVASRSLFVRLLPHRKGMDIDAVRRFKGL